MGVVTIQIPGRLGKAAACPASSRQLRGPIPHAAGIFYIENRFFLDNVHSTERK